MNNREEEQIKETVSYMKGMNDYARQEIARYVRGVYDGAQSVRCQYGLPPESGPAGQAGEELAREVV